MPLHHQTRACSGLPRGLGPARHDLRARPSAARMTTKPADEPAVIRDGFESPRTAWSQEQTDATINLQAHDRTTRAAHEGRTSEHFQFTAGLGSGFFFSYPLPKVPVTDTLKASLFVRSNRAGVQLFARVVLPGRHRPGHEAAVVPAGAGHDLRQRRSLAAAGAARSAVVAGAAGARLAGVDEAAGEPGGGVRRAARREPVHRRGRDRGVPRRAERRPGSRRARRRAAAGPSEPRAPSRAEAASPCHRPRRLPVARRLDRNRLKKRAEDGLYHDWVFTAIHAPGPTSPACGTPGSTS